MTTTQAEPAPAVADLPPSAKLVLKVLAHADGALTLREIRRRSYDLPDRTTRWALTRLVEADLVVESRQAGDARVRVYEAADTDGGGNTAGQ